MRLLLLLLLFTLSGFSQLSAQEIISINYEGRNKLTKSAHDAIVSSGYSPVYSVDAYTLSIQGTRSKFTLDSIMYEAVEEEYYSKFLCWKQIDKYYGNKSFRFDDCTFETEECYGGEINYVSDVSIDRNKIKKIIGLTCHFASYELDGTTFEVWFTEDLPFPDGPFGLDINNKVSVPLLPGIVLALKNTNTGTEFIAKDISIGGNQATESISGTNAKHINTYDKTSYIELRKQRSTRLSSANIVIKKWYPARSVK